jgi:hypothetical protein
MWCTHKVSHKGFLLVIHFQAYWSTTDPDDIEGSCYGVVSLFFLWSELKNVHHAEGVAMHIVQSSSCYIKLKMYV